MRALRVLRPLLVSVLAIALSGCRSGNPEGWSSRARRMVLTSGPSEIVMSSSRVPGYWARQADTGDEFFLYTRDRSYGRGSSVTVEGPFGASSPAVFREETGLYARWYAVFVLVVWKIGTDRLPAGLLPELPSRSGPKGQVMTVVSDAMFLRTARGDYVDGYFADCESRFEKQRLFLALELTPFAKGDRLDVSGGQTGDSVSDPAAGIPTKVPVFSVERAAPNVPAMPDIPVLKRRSARCP
jgi:hypothetical protein